MFGSFGLYSRGGGYGYDDDVNRSSWSEKSDAALRRERLADEQFDAFLNKCSSEDPNDASLFPITEEVVKADVHLTGPCYTSFRKRVGAKGCKVKRREATPGERKASGDKRQGKLYVISITCPGHPTKAADTKAKAALAAAAKKKKAQDAAVRKAEKERTEREERERLAALHRANVRERYGSIVGEGDEASKRKQSPVKNSSTMDSFVDVNVTSEALIKHAQTVHEERTFNIRTSVRKDEAELMAELRRNHAKEESDLRSQMCNKQSELISNANAEYDGIKAKINVACGKTLEQDCVKETGYYNGK